MNVIYVLSFLTFASVIGLTAYFIGKARKWDRVSDSLVRSLESGCETAQEAEHLSVEGIMDVLKQEGYVPELVDECTVGFKKEGISYRVLYSHNRMDLTLSFTMDKPDAEEAERVRDVCRRVSDTIIMADVFLDGPDNAGEYTVVFKISLILRTKAEFAVSFAEYMDIIVELHSRFYKEYDAGEDTEVQDVDETSDPASLPVGVSVHKLPS